MAAPIARTALRATSQSARLARPAAFTVAAGRSYASTPSSSGGSPQPVASTSTSPAESTAASASQAPLGAAAGSAHPHHLRPTPAPQPTNLPGSNLPSPSPASRYSPLTVSVVTKLAKLFGYHSQTSTAIRTSSDYYDRCAERGEIEAPFFYEGALSLSISKLSVTRSTK